MGFHVLKECVPSSTVTPDRWMCLNASPIKTVAHPLIFGLMMCIIVCIHISILHKKIKKNHTEYHIEHQILQIKDVLSYRQNQRMTQYLKQIGLKHCESLF